MGRNNKPSDDVIVPGTEEPTEVAAETPEVVVETEAPAVVVSGKEKTSAVRVIKSHSCTIFGTPYNLKKDTDAKLPNSVATILANAGVVIKK